MTQKYPLSCVTQYRRQQLFKQKEAKRHSTGQGFSCIIYTAHTYQTSAVILNLNHDNSF